MRTMDKLTQKFQGIHDAMAPQGAVNITLDYMDVGAILAALKCTDFYADEISRQIKSHHEKLIK
jgi:hypothetical protein